MTLITKTFLALNREQEQRNWPKSAKCQAEPSQATTTRLKSTPATTLARKPATEDSKKSGNSHSAVNLPWKPRSQMYDSKFRNDYFR